MFFVFFCAFADAFFAIFEHAVDEFGELVGGGGDGFGRAVASVRRVSSLFEQLLPRVPTGPEVQFLQHLEYIAAGEA